ncbi:MAG: N-succinylarginine dihydrolase [Planctomycetes bacterium TMED75]|nr:N-succinylarginine dihydrolase [Planctomycetaceae bacterium]OUU96262.1 MAG: N-succinylarginine dihydrolase [Planctomycetes bacterium TMED75]
MNPIELNLDGLVGPTHNYAGLSPGNLLSAKHARSVSHPRAAARQGLEKMKLVASLGIEQGVLPPHPRPSISWLNRLGFIGSESDVIEQASQVDPALLTACCSASGMWTANAATVSPSADTKDRRVHFTPANLSSLFHRSIEADWTGHLLREIFQSRSHFEIHDPLPGASAFSDEGAANHTRFAASHDESGVEFFVYGREGVTASTEETSLVTRRFVGRQTREASEAVARLHELDPARVVFARQSQEAIDAGVFHNDVISVGNGHVLLYHEQAFVGTGEILAQLRASIQSLAGGDSEGFLPLCVQQEELTLEEAAECYVFNSQLLTLPDSAGSMLLLVPSECEEHVRARRVLDRLLREENPITKVEFVDVRQSMRNGGGPACLRLRVALTEDELAHMHQGIRFTDTLHDRLLKWVDTHYRETLTIPDLADPSLVSETTAAYRALEDILQLPFLSTT